MYAQTLPSGDAQGLDEDDHRRSARLARFITGTCGSWIMSVESTLLASPCSIPTVDYLRQCVKKYFALL